MATCTIKGITFFVPRNGGNVYIEEGTRHGTLGRQIFRGRTNSNGWGGTAITATPETLETVARKWLRRQQRNSEQST